MSNTSQAFIANICAFVLWAIAALIYNELVSIDIWIVLALRILFSASFCLMFMLLPSVRLSIRKLTLREWRILFVSSILISANWYLVIASINLNQFSSASLGYFIAPILSILLLKRFKREQFSGLEIASTSLCLLGVFIVIKEQHLDSSPWLGITIAATFTYYSVLKKTNPIDPLVTLIVETSFALVPAILLIGWSVGTINFYFTIELWGMLLLLGAVTTLPIFLYIGSVIHLSSTAISFLQYLNPTFMLFIAIVFFGETIPRSVFEGYFILWLGIIVYVLGISYAVAKTILLRKD